jgi:hypothetical protein
MEHAMNEKMREMVGKGELSEASYKKLVDELGRTKEEADAPLFEVTYTVNMITARAHRSYDDDDDENDLHTNQSSFNLHGGPKSKIVRGVTKYRPFSTRGCHATNQFVDFDEIIIGADNEPKNCKPGDTIYQDSSCEYSHSGASHESCLVVYTIIKVSKFQKRKSSVLSEE